jgi:hypothetical protein
MPGSVYAAMEAASTIGKKVMTHIKIAAKKLPNNRQQELDF